MTITELEKLLGEVTNAPWDARSSSREGASVEHGSATVAWCGTNASHAGTYYEISQREAHANARFIALCRRVVPVLVDRIKLLQRDCELLEEKIEGLERDGKT